MIKGDMLYYLTSKEPLIKLIRRAVFILILILAAIITAIVVPIVKRSREEAYKNSPEYFIEVGKPIYERKCADKLYKAISTAGDEPLTDITYDTSFTASDGGGTVRFVYVNIYNLKSDKIGDYYTKKENSKKAKALVKQMRAVAETLESNSASTLTIEEVDGYAYFISPGNWDCDYELSYELTIQDGKDHTYTYINHNWGYEEVLVDDTTVYYDKTKSYNAVNSSKSSMTEKSNSSTGSGSYAGSPYSFDPADYDDPDEFAEDAEDEYGSYDAAYDAWEDY